MAACAEQQPRRTAGGGEGDAGGGGGRAAAPVRRLRRLAARAETRLASVSQRLEDARWASAVRAAAAGAGAVGGGAAAAAAAAPAAPADAAGWHSQRAASGSGSGSSSNGGGGRADGASRRGDASGGDASLPSRVAVVTTAAIPWLTGTSVNAALRAAHLCRRCKDVQLVVPWLPVEEQGLVMRQRFETPAEQAAHIRSWVKEQLGYAPRNLRIKFYAGRYVHQFHSVLGVGDATRSVDPRTELVVLEEPEHLNWFHHGRPWLEAFGHGRVVGIIHTNYTEYARREPNGLGKCIGLHHYNRLMTGVYCDGVVRLSGAVQDFPRQATRNVNGVSARFLRIGRARGADALPGGAYIIAKMQWGKAYTELLDLVGRDRSFNIDVYGSGDDAQAIVERARDEGLPMRFFGAEAGQGRYDHADDALRKYRVFVNPSLSDVVCTATAEALAMGKFVVVAEHPSNEFFAGFKNCLTYSSPEEFSQQVARALASQPAPLSEREQHMLSWDAATDRFLEVAMGEFKGKAPGALESGLAAVHQGVTATKLVRNLAGGEAVAAQHAPENVQLVRVVEEYNGFGNFGAGNLRTWAQWLSTR